MEATHPGSEAGTHSGLPSSHTRRVVAWVLGAKLLTLAVVGLFALAYPALFRHDAYMQVYRGNHGELPAAPPTADIVFRTWDAEHYLALAEHGYGRELAPRNAFYPLYPWTLRGLSLVTGGDLLAAGLLASLAFGVAALLLLHHVLTERFSHSLANGTVVLLCVQPAAFYTVLPYSESLFLLLSVVCFWALWRERLAWAALTVALMCLTRPVGILAVGPLLLHAWARPRRLSALALCLVPLLGWGAYFALIAWTTGDAATGFELQRHFAASPQAARLLDPLGFVASLLDVRAWHAVLGSALDRLVFLWVLIACTAMTLRKKPWVERDMEAFAWGVGVVPAITNAFMCFTRYASIAFPVHLQTARWLHGPRTRPLRWLVYVALAALQLWLLTRHVRHAWAG